MRLSELSGEPRKDIPSPEWADFRPDEGVLWLEHHKTVKKIGPKPIYLCPQIVAYINALPRIDEKILGGWHNGSKGWPRVCKGAKIKGVTLHDSRHTFASIGDDLGFSEATVGALLGHAASSQTGRYTHKLSKDLAAAAATIGGHIWSLLGF
jgi:integrase